MNVFLIYINYSHAVHLIYNTHIVPPAPDENLYDIQIELLKHNCETKCEKTLIYKFSNV